MEMIIDVYALFGIALFIALPVYEMVRQVRITRRLERLAKSGLSRCQLIARGLI